MYFVYFYSTFAFMSLADNIKVIREKQGLLQKEVANHIDVDKSTYSKIEKGTREVTVAELQQLTKLFNLTTDEILNYDENIKPKEITFEDKTIIEQMKLIEQLDEEDKTIVFKMVEKMLTSKKFKDFFNNNISTL
ncbi:helix-turn-helix domain-containing protein [Flavobacterium columnare]|uniref:helix-turn-helix domain-containing protein n=1 Tax=Flavobacterium columnare TaxID=996 RepID=UPI004034BA0E